MLAAHSAIPMQHQSSSQNSPQVRIIASHFTPWHAFPVNAPINAHSKIMVKLLQDELSAPCCKGCRFILGHTCMGQGTWLAVTHGVV